LPMDDTTLHNMKKEKLWAKDKLTYMWERFRTTAHWLANRILLAPAPVFSTRRRPQAAPRAALLSLAACRRTRAVCNPFVWCGP